MNIEFILTFLRYEVQIKLLQSSLPFFELQHCALSIFFSVINLLCKYIIMSSVMHYFYKKQIYHETRNRDLLLILSIFQDCLNQIFA